MASFERNETGDTALACVRCLGSLASTSVTHMVLARLKLWPVIAFVPRTEDAIAAVKPGIANFHRGPIPGRYHFVSKIGARNLAWVAVMRRLHAAGCIGRWEPQLS